MFLEMRIKITSLLLLGCIAVQSIYLTREPISDDDETTIEDDHFRMKIWTSDPTPDSKIILPSNSNQRKYPVWRSDMYQRLKIRSLEIRPLATKEDDGREKPRGQQVSKVSQREMPRVNTEVGTDYDDHRERNYVRVVQGEIFRTTDERNPLVKEEEVDLGFLDDLGGLAPYLPDTEDSSVPLNKEESSGGFFNWLLSMLGLTSPVVDEKIKDEESTEPKFNRSTSASSGSFFNWLLSTLGLTSPVVDETIRDKRSTDPKFNRSTSSRRNWVKIDEK